MLGLEECDVQCGKILIYIEFSVIDRRQTFRLVRVY